MERKTDSIRCIVTSYSWLVQKNEISQWETTNFFSKFAFTWAKIILHRHWRMVKTRKLPYSNKENFDPFLSNMVHTDLRPFFSSTLKEFSRTNHIFSRTTFPLNLNVWTTPEITTRNLKQFHAMFDAQDCVLLSFQSFLCARQRCVDEVIFLRGPFDKTWANFSIFKDFSRGWCFFKEYSRLVGTMVSLSSRKRPSSISDHLGLTFWMVAYGRFDLIQFRI